MTLFIGKRTKDCRHCGNPFLPLMPMQTVCGPICARRVAETKRKVEKADIKRRKEALKKLSVFKAEAQDAFNKYIRARDADLPCVSCGETDPPMLPGGQWDAGHFLGRGAYPELAFHEDNCHKQCKSCNAGSGKFSHKERTVREKYEPELLRRIGPERLAALKAPHPPKKYTREEFASIRETYKNKRKQLEKE